MAKLTKRQQKRIDYFLREKQSRKEKSMLLHDSVLPKYIERHIPYVRRMSRNIDQLLIVASFVQPALKPGLIDRLLIVAELENVLPLICLNKADLVDTPGDIDNIRLVYEKIGYPVLVTSVKDGRGMADLDVALRGKRSALAGHSGVGKSSLLNKIEPALQVAVGEISDVNNKGRHTTTQVLTYRLDASTEVIDLPGMKMVDFVDIHRDEARFFYGEFADFAEGCKFNNCLHLSEKQCAVKAAVEAGEISRIRYRSYCNFVDSL